MFMKLLLLDSLSTREAQIRFTMEPHFTAPMKVIMFMVLLDTAVHTQNNFKQVTDRKAYNYLPVDLCSKVRHHRVLTTTTRYHL